MARSHMTGIRQYRAALKAAPEHLRDGIVGAIRETVEGVHTRGKANIAAMTVKRSGELARNYRRSVAPKSLRGRVGYLSPAARELAFYARFINDGTAKMEARPFHTNATEAERELDTSRMVKARDDALARLGGRGRALLTNRLAR